MPLAEEIIDNFQLSPLNTLELPLNLEEINQGPIHECCLSISIMEQSCHDCHIQVKRDILIT